MKRIPTWDLPTRLFHWTLAALILCAYLSYKFGDITMTWHKWNGYAILTLCLYRLFWGLFGSSTARFSDFVKGPRTVFAYLKSLHSKTPEKYHGHNPVGALMVLALLCLILIQGSMGLFTSDDILVEGPLVYLASAKWVSLAGTIHRIGFWVIAGFAAIHVLAALFYLFFKKENLIKTMISGQKQAETVPQHSRLVAKPIWQAIGYLCLSALLIGFTVNIARIL